MNTQLHLLAEKARASISEFCINECHAYCCRKGYLTLSKKEMLATVQDKQLELEEAGRLTPMENDEYALNLQGDCPSLKNNKCLIHKHPDRSKTCAKFPIFIEKEVRLSERCLAVKENKLYEFTSKVKNFTYLY